MDDDHNVVILIPAYNEAKTIRLVVTACLQYRVPVVVVDDGSTDNTIAQVQSMPVILLRHASNQGKGAALVTGFQYALNRGFSGVITLDADGQHDPTDLPRFFEKITQMPSVFMIGARMQNTQAAPKGRLVANKLSDFFVSLVAKKRLYDTQSGYRYYPVDFLRQYLQSTEHYSHFAFEVEVLVAVVFAGVSVGYLDIFSCYPDNARVSYYRAWRDTWEIAKVLVRQLWKR